MQSYERHTHRPTGYLLVMVLLVVPFISSLIRLWKLPNIDTAMQAMTMLALVLLPVVVRRSLTTLQDRGIRTDMRIRLARAMPDGDAIACGLSYRQLVALRFASDAELPALVQEVTSKNITDAKEIKQKIKNWQADVHRA